MSESIITELQAVLDSRCRDLDEQLNTALQLVRNVRTKRYELAREIAERLGIVGSHRQPDAASTTKKQE